VDVNLIELQTAIDAVYDSSRGGPKPNIGRVSLGDGGVVCSRKRRPSRPFGQAFSDYEAILLET
jgi:hypothetical protein